MDELTESDRLSLINAIALREGNIGQLKTWYGLTIEELRAFLDEHKQEIIAVREKLEETDEEDNLPNPNELADLWISNKLARLSRYQKIANDLYNEASSGSRDATTLRELRFYMTAAANELGQLLHRGSGETGSDSLSVDIQGVELDNLR